MATQKAALVGCKEGPWVSTSGMRDLGLKVQAELGSKLMVLQTDGERQVAHQLDDVGYHKLHDLPWTKVSLLSGDHSSALCFLVSGNG